MTASYCTMMYLVSIMHSAIDWSWSCFYSVVVAHPLILSPWPFHFPPPPAAVWIFTVWLLYTSCMKKSYLLSVVALATCILVICLCILWAFEMMGKLTNF